MPGRRECLKSAITHLKDALGLFVEAQMPGGELPPKDVIQRAAALTAEAHLQLEHLLAPPNPYADDKLRSGLNFHKADEPELPFKGEQHG